jgi:RHS repeat-associated protein
LFNRFYEYDNVGNLRYMYDDIAGDQSNLLVTYDYDDLDRLTNADGYFGTQTYSYDDLGNRDVVNGVQYYYDYSPDKRSQLTRIGGDYSFDYDENGNMETKIGPEGTTTYAWDCANNLVQIGYPPAAGGGSSEFVYDNSGGRIKKTDPGGRITYYVYSGSSVIYTEEVFDGSSTETEYYYANGKLRANSTTQNPYDLYYHHSDYLGSTRLITDTSGTDFGTYDNYPFGEPLDTEITGDPGRFTFTEKEQDDASGLYYFGARYYDPTTGRFISPDPIPSYTNPYSYCANNPLKFVDPSGMTHIGAWSTYSWQPSRPIIWTPWKKGYQDHLKRIKAGLPVNMYEYEWLPDPNSMTKGSIGAMSQFAERGPDWHPGLFESMYKAALRWLVIFQEHAARAAAKKAAEMAKEAKEKAAEEKAAEERKQFLEYMNTPGSHDLKTGNPVLPGWDMGNREVALTPHDPRGSWNDIIYSIWPVLLPDTIEVVGKRMEYVPPNTRPDSWSDYASPGHVLNHMNYYERHVKHLDGAPCFWDYMLTNIHLPVPREYHFAPTNGRRGPDGSPDPDAFRNWPQ